MDADHDGAGESRADDPPRDVSSGLSESADAPAIPDRAGSHRVLAWIAIIVTGMLVTASLTLYSAYYRLNANIKRYDLAGLGAARPIKLNNALNILLLGSDNRQGANAEYGNIPPGGADTTILLHLSPGGTRALAVSFPRDLVTTLPACPPDGHDPRDHPGQPAHFGQINASFVSGGPVCTVKTIERLTNIRIDHFAVLDFTGFKAVVAALGGVDVCVPSTMADNLHTHQTITAGWHHMGPEMALEFVRMRYGVKDASGVLDGADTKRVQRQQIFLAQVFKKAVSARMLANPVRAYSFLDAVTKSLTVDAGMTVSDMVRLAESMRQLTAPHLQFTTVPWQPDAADSARIDLRQPDADAMFASLRADRPLPIARVTAGSGRLSPRQVAVTVVNAGIRDGLAGQTATLLTARGFAAVSDPADPYHQVARTRIEYGPSGRQAAATLAAALGGRVALRQVAASSGADAVTLVIGADWPAGATGLAPTAAATGTAVVGGVNTFSAAANPCRAAR